MIQVISNPQEEKWAQLAARPSIDSSLLERSVEEIIRAVKKGGDASLLSFTEIIDGVKLDSPLVAPEEFDGVENLIDDSLKEAIKVASGNVEKFHTAQFREDIEVETMPGVKCFQKSLPLKRVGLYIPGGSAPLFSTLLMLALPAKIAGCKEIVIATPPNKSGRIAPSILYIAKLLGITQVVKAGGAQAIAALAYGTESIPKVDKIFGPGNQFVSEAKIQVSKIVSIDMLAGPSEVVVIADSSANASFVASDLLAQAEHGPDSQVFLLTDSPELAQNTLKELESQIISLPRVQTAEKSLSNSKVIIFENIADAVRFSNLYAPEHLIISAENPWEIAANVEAAGSVFIGSYSPESVGDYASGTNHTLPTSGWAKSASGVSLESFMHKITFQELTKEGLVSIAEAVETMAAAEGLGGHRKSVSIRLNS